MPTKVLPIAAAQFLLNARYGLIVLNSLRVPLAKIPDFIKAGLLNIRHSQ